MRHAMQCVGTLLRRIMSMINGNVLRAASGTGRQSRGSCDQRNRRGPTLWYSRNPTMQFAYPCADAACPGPDSWGNDVHNSEGAMTE
jgi:hypothetical protein